MVHLKDSLAHQWRAGHWLCSGGQYSALTREDPSLDTDCATAMAPPLWTLQERRADSMCWLDWLHSTATQCKWQQSMLEGLDHTVQLSLWRYCRIVSNEQIIIVALLVCVPVQFLVQCLVCQPLQEWPSSQSHGLLPQNLMVSSQCIRSPTTALEYWTTPTHQPHTAHTEGPPSQHCCWIQCQSIHYHRTRRFCFKHYINYRYSWAIY